VTDARPVKQRVRYADNSGMVDSAASGVTRATVRTRFSARGLPLPDRLLVWGLNVALAVVVVQTIGHLVDWLATDLDIVLLNADSDQSIYPWVSVVAIFSGALALFLYQQLTGAVGFRRWLPFILAYLSLDEMVALHERIVRVLKALNVDESYARVIWPVLYLPLIAATALALWRMSPTFVPRAARFIKVGLVFLGTAVALEILSKALVDDYPNAYQVEVIVEQNLELAGWTLIGTALVSHVVRNLLRTPLADVSA